MRSHDVCSFCRHFGWVSENQDTPNSLEHIPRMGHFTVSAMNHALQNRQLGLVRLHIASLEVIDMVCATSWRYAVDVSGGHAIFLELFF